MKKIFIASVLTIFISGPLCLFADDWNKAKYEPEKKDPVLQEMREQRRQIQKERQDVTEQIRARQKKEKDEKEKQERLLVADMAGVFPPASPKDFQASFHFPPVAQYTTSTCWSFSATSFFESEIYRLTGKKMKLSDMWAPYHELIEKCRRFIAERGESYVSGGAESNSVTRIWKEAGIVPQEAYTGLTAGMDKHDHVLLMREIDGYLGYIETNDLWDEQENLRHIGLILNRHLGQPPREFTYQGKTFTPPEFLQHTGLNLDDYVSVMSTSYFPFFTMQEFLAPDNWWHSSDYINLPLDIWYATLKNAIQSGYSAVIGGDVSEPGKLGLHDVAFIPSFDIPEKYINQDSREYRIYNGSTEDDHGVHLVGFRKFRGRDWFLVKDSGRSARWGKHQGYYFFRGDFIKLKMLTYTVHRDMLKDILPRIKKDK